MNPTDISFIWQLWLDIWSLFAGLIQIFNTDIFYYVERFIYNAFDITVDIPFSFTMIEVLTTPLLITIIALGVVAFIFRVVKDIVNPFN